MEWQGEDRGPGAAALSPYPAITTALGDLGLEPISLWVRCLMGYLQGQLRQYR